MVTALDVPDVPLQHVHRLLVGEAQVRGHGEAVLGEVAVQASDGVQVGFDSGGVWAAVRGGWVWEIADEDVVTLAETGDVGHHFFPEGELPLARDDTVCHNCRIHG